MVKEDSKTGLKQAFIDRCFLQHKEVIAEAV